ncbi:nephrocystin-1 isoform X1 [Brienomyrus brachyistius]|uniref:nephrocystin-1 isoform X1 n=2 Tax=Brienomyrus brachyistius TaxID=42636 RepID=UPI0020B222B8|nr:nephrocystin-1 isoform X1 [Brienomyrus brachyistius]
MPPKKRGPLQTVQRDTDGIKKQVDSLVREVKQLNVDTEDSRLAEASQRCNQLLKSVEETMRTLKKLTKADEPAPVGNYDQRKLDEEKRLETMKKQLLSLSAVASPAQKADSKNQAGSSGMEDDDGEEAESEEEDDDEDEEDDDEEQAEKQRPEKDASCFIVLSAFKGEQDGDLTVQKGEILHILSRNPDGWWLARNAEGKKGLVPKTFLKVHQEEEEEEEEDKEDSDTGEESDEVMDEESATNPRSCQSNWDTVRKAITEISATDVLAAMGAIPAGFRPSTLSKLLAEGSTYRSSYFIQPELSQSQLVFKDLFWNPDTGSVRPRISKISLMLTLWSCRMIPRPGVGVQVLSRHVRFCVFDGIKVLSNIHTVRANAGQKNQKTWTFSPRTTGILPSLLDGDCFIRSDCLSSEVGILFELGVSYIRNSTGERGDLSCGWAFLGLFDVSGVPIPHRTYELTVHGGTPYEKDVDVDPSINRRAMGSMLHQMLISRKQPKLIVKLRSPSTSTRASMNLLPDTLIGSSSSVPLLALYRQVLADALLRDRLTMQNADLICSPVLVTFPHVLDHTDLLDALRGTWAEKEGALRRSEKRDPELLKGLFVRVYLDRVFPLLHSTRLPAPQWADEEREGTRWGVIFGGTVQDAAQGDAGLAALLAADAAQEAFDITQVTYDFLASARKGVANT